LLQAPYEVEQTALYSNESNRVVTFLWLGVNGYGFWKALQYT